MNIVGSMFIETAAGVVEVAMVEQPDGSIQPGGVRDANKMGRPEVLPTMQQMREALRLAKWCYLNKEVFTEARVSNVPLSEWKEEYNDGENAGVDQN